MNSCCYIVISALVFYLLLNSTSDSNFNEKTCQKYIVQYKTVLWNRQIETLLISKRNLPISLSLTPRPLLMLHEINIGQKCTLVKWGVAARPQSMQFGKVLLLFSPSWWNQAEWANSFFFWRVKSSLMQLSILPLPAGVHLQRDMQTQAVAFVKNQSPPCARVVGGAGGRERGRGAR